MRHYVRLQSGSLRSPCILCSALSINAWSAFFPVGMDTGPCAGPSRLLTTAQRAPFADQLADASAFFSITTA